MLSVDTTPSQIGFGAGWRFFKCGGKSTAGYNAVLASLTYEKKEFVKAAAILESDSRP